MWRSVDVFEGKHLNGAIATQWTREVELGGVCLQNR
jgi:hypothetical protein